MLRNKIIDVGADDSRSSDYMCMIYIYIYTAAATATVVMMCITAAAKYNVIWADYLPRKTIGKKKTAAYRRKQNRSELNDLTTVLKDWALSIYPENLGGPLKI